MTVSSIPIFSIIFYLSSLVARNTGPELGATSELVTGAGAGTWPQSHLTLTPGTCHTGVSWVGGQLGSVPAATL